MKDVWEMDKTLIVWRGGTLDLYIKTSNDTYTKLVRGKKLRYTDTVPDYNLVNTLDSYENLIVYDTNSFRYKIKVG